MNHVILEMELRAPTWKACAPSPLNPDPYLCDIILGFGTIPGITQGLLLALHSKITPERA